MLIRRALSLLLFALLCAVASYWFVQLRAPAPSIAPVAMDAPPPPALDVTTHARLFGESAVAANSSIRVAGVMAPLNPGGQGIALLMVDDKPARAFATGQVVTPGTSLLEVHTDMVMIDQGGARVQLAVPQNKGSGSAGISPAGRSPVALNPVPPPSAAPAMQPGAAGTPGNPARAIDPNPALQQRAPGDLQRPMRPGAGPG
jgi:general secretion pathway protein C